MALRTTEVGTTADIRSFFDAIAPVYGDCHGPPDRLLRYRLQLIDRLLADTPRQTLVEIGCGTGLHLFPLAASFEQAIGTDLSPGMIAVAETLRRAHPNAEKIALRVDPAEALATVDAGVADAVLCVGALEHMPDKPAVLRQVSRILKPGGAFVCLTPNGDYGWYRWVAPRLGLATRHLSTDQFPSRAELTRWMAAAGFRIERLAHWTFIPRGDVPRGWAGVLSLVDGIGRGLGVCRGGLAVRAVKPGAKTPASAPGYQAGE